MDAFEAIAVGQFPYARKKTLDAFLAAGLIKRGPDEIIGEVTLDIPSPMARPRNLTSQK